MSDPYSSENIKKNKFSSNYTFLKHTQTTENQSQRRNLVRDLSGGSIFTEEQK